MASTPQLLRKAILIGGDDASVPRNKLLSGATKDLRDLSQFLMDPSGGAWLKREIEYYKAPRRADLDVALRRARAS